MKAEAQLITTIGERCRVCYTCVRDCPAKAIRVAGGQSEVLPERCIGCGNCVRVCSQKAKQVYDSTAETRALLAAPAPCAAILAPSFPAEFTDHAPERLVGMLRRLGFDLVAEVAFGADLVAEAYGKRLGEGGGDRWIATTCPAVVAYVEKYHPGLAPNLAPIVSPMVAEARVLRRLHREKLRIVFIGPCLAKKVEADRSGIPGAPEIDAVLTFTELRRLFAEAHIDPDDVPDAAFDPPHPRLGALFPISRGMLQAAGVVEDLLSGDVVAADGRNNFTHAIREFERGALDARLLEILCCNGCVMGSGMSVETPLFRRRAAVSHYARARMKTCDGATYHRVREACEGLDLRRSFDPQPLDLAPPCPEAVAEVLARMGKASPEDELNCGACGYPTCREHAVAVVKGLAESEMCLPYTIDRLRSSLDELHESNEKLANTQQALINAEKLASMGQLSAGIAHEINNPLGVILLYAKMMEKESPADSPQREDVEMIAEQAERCRKIVSGLLNFARKNKVVRRPVDICGLIDRCLKATLVPANVHVAVDHQVTDPVAEIDQDQVIQVLANVVGNAIEAMPKGGQVTISTWDEPDAVHLHIADTGTGITPENLPRIFEPFFTTKQMGKGTGLGLAVTYGIVKMHRGRIDVESAHDPARGPTGTTFRIRLPRRGEDE